MSPCRWGALAGRETRAEIDAAVKVPPASPQLEGEWRTELGRRLRAERGAGTIPARVAASPHTQGNVLAAKRVTEAAEEFPASWIRRGNLVGLLAR